MSLRPYQRRAIDDLYKWFEMHKTGNPCLVLPTGSGKSHVVAALCKEALQNWPETRILMLTHVKELIEQNAEKMLLHWPDAPLGIYSAGIGRRDLGEPITFAGIQSVRNLAKEIGHVDLIVIDEAHMVNHKAEGGYRSLIKRLKGYNQHLRVIGLTATPFRLGHGYITEGEALFDDLLDPVTIEELVHQKYLAPLRSKLTQTRLDVTGVHKRGGEYIESELQAAVNKTGTNRAVVQEVIERAGDRKAWLFFCAGVKHARAISAILNECGIAADCITGDTPKKERETIIERFKSGELRALTNANVLTTGFDYPDIDLIAMLRPTLSAGLYVQMAGRGMRLKSHTDHCLVLDFAGVVETHGPIVDVQPPKKKGEGNGEAPVKICESCNELCHPRVEVCPSCGHHFPPPERKKLVLRDVDIMGTGEHEMDVSRWYWSRHISNTSGKEMVKVTYFGRMLSDPSITEYIPILHEGYAGQKAMRTLYEIALQAKVKLSDIDDLEWLSESMTKGKCPAKLKYNREGKYYRIKQRIWNGEDPDGTRGTEGTGQVVSADTSRRSDFRDSERRREVSGYRRQTQSRGRHPWRSGSFLP
jgi:DNA repair protein RadD